MDKWDCELWQLEIGSQKLWNNLSELIKRGKELFSKLMYPLNTLN